MGTHLHHVSNENDENGFGSGPPRRCRGREVDPSPARVLDLEAAGALVDQREALEVRVRADADVVLSGARWRRGRVPEQSHHAP